jgi:putative FmdB family regulatory protein
MPTYDYRCRKCGHVFELFHSISDDKPKRCPKCKGRADKLVSAGSGIIFKGSGFYITDYRSRHYKERAKQEKSGGGSEGGGSSSGSESKGKGSSDKGGSKGSSSSSKSSDG